MDTTLGKTGDNGNINYSKLNYTQKFSYTAEGAKYEPKKLNDGKAYEWKLKADSYNDTTN